MKPNIKKSVILSLICMFCGLISVSFFESDFHTSIANIVILLIIFTVDNVYPSVLFALTGVGLYLLRILVSTLSSSDLLTGIQTFAPELLFYLVYGVFTVLYLHLFEKHRNSSLWYFLPFILFDYLANNVELLVRMGTKLFLYENQLTILSVAFIRTLIFVVILKFFEQYRLLLIQKEHEDRYKQILIFIARLNEDVVWLEKNTDMIEKTMSTSYKLYDRLNTRGGDKELAKMALAVSHDVHEIKKEYLLILRGLSVVLETEEHDDGMYIKDLINLIKESILSLAKERKQKVSLEITIKDNFYTKKQYLLLSVFRNMLVNALESSDKRDCHIVLTEHQEEDMYVFTISDNGSGISQENIVDIFQPGYSTKINYETGEVNRGMGLSLVKNMIDIDFKGHIKVESSHKGTTFTIALNKEALQ